jgi:CRISPR-associated protein Cas2
MKTNYLVCYDIKEERRLQRVYNKMKSWGLHLQYSVFYCLLTRQELDRLTYEIKEIIDPHMDDIRIYPLPARPEIIVLGCGDRVPGGVEVFL